MHKLIHTTYIEGWEGRPRGGESGDATEQTKLVLTLEATPRRSNARSEKTECEREHWEGEIVGERE